MDNSYYRNFIKSDLLQKELYELHMSVQEFKLGERLDKEYEINRLKNIIKDLLEDQNE